MNEPLNDETIQRMWKFAEMIAPAKHLPTNLRNDPASIFYVLATGQELGINWTHALRSTFTGREGALAMKGEVLLALLQAHGFAVDFEFTEKPIGSTCTITRPHAKPISRSFTMDEAQLIETRWIPEDKRWERLSDNYYYKNYPKAMCQWRSLSICGRVAAADITGGIYLPDELVEADDPKDERKHEVAGKPADPAASEFIVGEKEPPADKKATDLANPLDNTKPAAAETNPVVAETKPAAIDTKPSVKEEKKQPREVWAICSDLPITGPPVPMKDEPAQATEQAALLRAQALANTHNKPFYVLRMLDGVSKDMPKVCYPPEKPKEIPKPVASAPGTAATPAAPAVASTPAPAGNPQDEFNKLIGIMRGRIGGETKAADKLVGQYLLGYLDPLPVPKGDYATLVPILAKLVDAGGVVGELKENAKGLGARLSGRKGLLLTREFDMLKWPVVTRQHAHNVMGFLNLDEKNFIDWINMPCAGDLTIASMEPAALDIVLPLFLLVKGNAFVPVDWAIANGKPVLSTLLGMVEAAGLPIEKWDATFAQTIIAAIVKMSEPDPLGGELFA